MTKKYKPEIQLMDVDKIKPYEKNAKIHTEAQIKSLAEVIKNQGWDVPIVVDKDGVVIKGHGRRLAALSLGLKQVPVIVRSDMTPAEVRAARLSDNQVAIGDFDIGLVKEELENLKLDGFEVTGLGFAEKELAMLLGNLDEVNFDVFDENVEAPESGKEKVEAILIQPEEASLRAKNSQVIDLLGFKSIPFEEKDYLVEFVALAELKTGLEGGAAFMAFIKTILEQEAGE